MSPLPVFSRLLRPLMQHPNPWVRGTALAVFLTAGALLAYQGLSGNRAAPASVRPVSPEKHTGYDRLPEARLVQHRNNDGDSFRVRQGGREFELRLYFVDTPEKYLSDRYPEQRARVAEQARDLGLSPEQAVSVGQKARDSVHGLLGGRTFTVHTRWERVFDSERVYGFVELPDPDKPGKNVYLCELLMRRMLARLHTQGAPPPDGRSEKEYAQLLAAQKKPLPGSSPARR